MTSAIKVMTKTQVGKEVTPGTLVAATRRLVASGLYDREQAMWDPTEIDSGVFARVPIAPVRIREASRIELTTPLDHTQILLPLLSGMKGGVTAVGAGADKTWTFDPSTSIPPAVDTYTVEFNEQSTADSAEFEFGFGFTDQIQITVGTDGVAELKWSMWGRATQEATATAALTVPTLQRVPGYLFKVYLDTTWAALGGAAKLGQVYAAQWTYKNNIHPGFYLDGRTQMDFSQPEYGRPEAELTLDVVHDPAAALLVQSEETAKTNVTPRFIQLEAIGPTLGGATYKIEIDGSYYHAEDSMTRRGEDRDGNPTVRMHLLSAYDPTSAFQSRVVVVTDAATFP